MKRRLALLGSAFLILALTFGLSFREPEASATVPGVNQLVDQDSSDANSPNNSAYIGSPHSVSGDGRYVVFTSSASNLVSDDTNGTADVFLRDTQSGTTTMVDVSSSGVQADNGAGNGAISYDGRYVVFNSTATNLVSGVSGGGVYERDLINGTTTFVSTNTAGTPIAGGNPDVNADGRYVVFQTDQPGGQAITGTPDPYSTGEHFTRIAIKDILTGTTQLIGGRPYGNSMLPTIDCDGHVVAFESGGIAGDGTPSYSDFQHNAFNFYYSTVDWNTNPSSFLGNTSYPDQVNQPQVSCDGNYVVYNNGGTVGVYSRLTKTSVSVNSSDNSTNTTARYLRAMSISDDGRYVAFTSGGTNMDSSHGNTGRGSDYDVFVRDMKTNSDQLVSFTTAGTMSGLVSSVPLEVSISPDGSKVVYNYTTPSSSGPSELISGVHTGFRDVYESQTGF